jgi:hypothetical protein
LLLAELKREMLENWVLVHMRSMPLRGALARGLSHLPMESCDSPVCLALLKSDGDNWSMLHRKIPRASASPGWGQLSSLPPPNPGLGPGKAMEKGTCHQEPQEALRLANSFESSPGSPLYQVNK